MELIPKEGGTLTSRRGTITPEKGTELTPKKEVKSTPKKEGIYPKEWDSNPNKGGKLTIEGMEITPKEK